MRTPKNVDMIRAHARLPKPHCETRHPRLKPMDTLLPHVHDARHRSQRRPPHAHACQYLSKNTYPNRLTWTARRKRVREQWLLQRGERCGPGAAQQRPRQRCTAAKALVLQGATRDTNDIMIQVVDNYATIDLVMHR